MYPEAFGTKLGSVYLAMANVEGIGDEWEGIPEIRDFVRTTGVLCERPVGQKWCEPTRPNCVANAKLLLPLLERMHDDPQLKLPTLEDLKKQVGVVYHRIGTKTLPEKEIYTTAVELKKLCSFVKRRTNRLEVTKVWDWTKKKQTCRRINN